MGTDLRSEGRQQLLPVGMVRGRVYPADRGSGAITSLSGADGFIEILPKTEFIEAGTPVEVTLFGEVEKPDLLIAGSFCPGIDVLEDLSGLRFRTLYSGSSGGFSAIAAKTADIAGVDMPSKPKEKAGTTYNIPTIERMGLSGAVLAKGYRREVGLLVRQESLITGLGDLPGKRLINRNRGSGIRELLDMKIEELAGEKGISKKEFTNSISGYSSGAKSEISVCEAVLSGKADAGVGLKNCAEKKKGLKFIKFAEEEYDFLIRKEVLETPEVKKLLQTLFSAEFASKLPSGLQVYERTGEIIHFE
ncbi:hypothetical protein SDC9_118789 [bioreactor metagenome]|uniref:PBP domain-containing protein n=1 Tax=bioreactor metagenome TaxID=1076179 RepID=A0A645C385_9ZZZZ